MFVKESKTRPHPRTRLVEKHDDWSYRRTCARISAAYVCPRGRKWIVVACLILMSQAQLHLAFPETKNLDQRTSGMQHETPSADANLRMRAADACLELIMRRGGSLENGQANPAGQQAAPKSSSRH
ncbi:hypothetical protein K491DRAFT_491551 [Lophiostoma macrostomum CBS 122681]|uniref:Uncharacterized protein n=1 Tax=Lophiostoma macrostomum CBS 122681 TaxID=1314788 RepID=A0A6A6T244_9PLEO|nr:hypothetical protein K491DRAFT_491551 [Lophiostoma macrostomum CBS 122681]